jgi:outer membrane protein assembly factor BamD (BamD/ComL family)
MLFRRQLGIVLGLAISCAPALAQQALAPGFLPTNELQLQNYSAEFPPIGAAYSTMRPELLANYMARQLREMPNAPETFETLLLMERPDLAAAALGRIIRDSPEEAAWAFGLLAGRNMFPALMADARSQLARLAPAAAAKLELALIFVEPGTSGPAPNMRRADALRALIAKYPGTDAALEAEVDLIASTTANRAAWIKPLEDFAKQHPGTTAAAKALYEKAFQTSANLNFRNQDPTDAYLDVLAIVADLRSGRYPPSRWVARAPWLAIELSPRNPQFTAGNVERLLVGYLDFVKANFTLPTNSQMAEGVNSVVTYQIFNLFEQSGEGIAGVERTITDLERIDAARARYLRGAFYVSRLRNEPAATRPALVQKAIEVLSGLAGNGVGLYSRRALATLASLQYAEGNFTAARTAFSDYLAANPDTTFSWVAAIRIGQCHQLLGDLDASIAAFRSAATRYGSISIARELGHAFAGRASEAASRFDDSVAEYQRALEQWGDLRRTAQMEDRGLATSAWTFVEVQGQVLKTRLEQLRASLATPEGTQLERGRWLLTSNDRVGALAALETFVRTYPTSTLALDARKLLQRTRLELALEQAGPASAPRDEAGAITALAAIDSQPWDEFSGVTRIVAATLTFRRGLREQADAMMAAAIRDWQNNQVPAGPPTLPIAVADDVAAIRGQIFALESPTASWRSSFEWKRIADPVTIFNPHITVQLFGAVPTRETVYPTSAPKSAIFMSSEAMQLLVNALNALAEERPRVPREMIDFVSAHLPADTALLGGAFTSFGSIPNVQAVTFTNAERTRATATIRTFSSGGALLLEKTGGTWRVVGVGGTYVN